MFFNGTDKRYNQYSAHLKQKFGAKVYKIMSYFQAFTNTYKPVSELEKIYSAALKHPDIVGLSVGTRPDCIDEDKLKLISGYAKDYYTWIEYGLQSVHDKTLNWINRGHDYNCFLRAYEKTKNYGINICVHLILGLNETYEEMIETAKKVAVLEPEGIKIHMLCALEGTKIADLYNSGEMSFMSEDEYINLCCDYLELLPAQTTIHRLAGNGLKKNLVAPRWLGKKLDALNKIDSELERRGSWQGCRYF